MGRELPFTDRVTLVGNACTLGWHAPFLPNMGGAGLRGRALPPGGIESLPPGDIEPTVCTPPTDIEHIILYRIDKL